MCYSLLAGMRKRCGCMTGRSESIIAGVCCWHHNKGVCCNNWKEFRMHAHYFRAARALDSSYHCSGGTAVIVRSGRELAPLLPKLNKLPEALSPVRGCIGGIDE
jgi:hypothetical protein